MTPIEPNQPIDRFRARLLNRAFHLLYGPFAWGYDWVSRTFFLGQWRRWQHASIKHLVGPDVLELGMGTGDLQADLERAGLRAWGIDLSPQMIREAVRKGERRGVRYRVCRARAQALPFPSEFFSSVVSTFPSDYIADPETLAEIERVLRPGGRLVVVPGGWLHRRGVKGRTLEGVARIVYGSGKDGEGESVVEQVRSNPRLLQWIGRLNGQMSAGGFSVEARVASNRYGACLVIIAVKPEL